MYLSALDKIIEIYRRSALSISKFAKVIGKDRRTVTSWLDKTTNKEPSVEVKQAISKFFRYPYKIWEESCSNDEFVDIITGVPQEEIRIIDEGYYGGLLYILECEHLERFVIHQQFPGPMYRDKIVPRVYKDRNSQEIEELKKIRIKKMLDYSFQSIEWYSIQSMLSFAFSEVGNFYTKEHKLYILDLMYDTFYDNYNKSLYFFDSHSRKIYGMDTAYTSINIKKNIMFFKAPIESVFIEIRNKKLIEKIHKYFTSVTKSPSHVNRMDSINILKSLQKSIELDESIIDFYEKINKETDYGELFLNNLSIHLHKRVSKPKDGQKRN